jgi:hypothetical protein
MCLVVDDPADAWVETTRRARKRWRCVECYGPIPVGAEHVMVSTLYDGGWCRTRMHTECRWLWSFLVDVVCGGKSDILLGSLEGELDIHDAEEPLATFAESGDIVSSPELAKLLPWIADRYREMEAAR